MARTNRARALGVAALVTALAACGGGGERGDEHAAPGTTAPGTMASTTAAPTTVTHATAAPTSATGTTAPVTAGPTAPPDDGSAGFVPACVDRLGDGPAPQPLDLPADLEPLGRDPSLVIRLPRFRDRDGAEAGDVVAGVTPVPGGIVVLVGQDPYDTGALGWQLVVVGHDGAIRWRRCGTDEYVDVIGAGERSARVLVWTSARDGEPGVRAFDVASGIDVDASDVDLPAGRPVATGGGFVLLGRTDGTRVDRAVDRLTLLDITDGSSVEVPYPERAEGQEPFRLLWELVGAEPAIVQRDPFGAAVGVHTGGAWTTDPGSIAEVVGLSVTEVYGDEPGVAAFAPDGSRRWFHPTEGALPGEGFHWTVAGDTVLANACREADAAGGCAVGELVALDLATGDVRWSLPGFRSVGVAGERYAIVSDDPAAAGARPYRMLELSTGAPLPGQQWPSHAFDTGCCGESDFVVARTARGVVWAVDYDTIRIYHPATVAHPTVIVDLSR